MLIHRKCLLEDQEKYQVLNKSRQWFISECYREWTWNSEK